MSYRVPLFGLLSFGALGFAACIGDKFYVTGGSIGQVDMYDPATNRWTMLRKTPEFWRRFAASAVVNGRLYVIGGEALDTRPGRCPPLRRISIYNPLTNALNVQAPLPTARGGGRGSQGLHWRAAQDRSGGREGAWQ